MDFFGIISPDVDAWVSSLRGLPYDFFHTPIFARAWQAEVGLPVRLIVYRTVERLGGLLEPDDIIIDGGNGQAFRSECESRQPDSDAWKKNWISENLYPEKIDQHLCGLVTLPNRAHSTSAGTSGSCRGDDFVPCLHRRGPQDDVGL